MLGVVEMLAKEGGSWTVVGFTVPWGVVNTTLVDTCVDCKSSVPPVKDEKVIL